jgi:hypothetical protein
VTFVSNFVRGKSGKQYDFGIAIWILSNFNKLDRIAFAPYRTGAPYPPHPRLS